MTVTSYSSDSGARDKGTAVPIRSPRGREQTDIIMNILSLKRATRVLGRLFRKSMSSSNRLFQGSLSRLRRLIQHVRGWRIGRGQEVVKVLPKARGRRGTDAK